MFKKSALVLIECLSPLHIGTGRKEGIVDLPIDRDNFGFPFIPSSGLKGALRERFLNQKDEERIFGSENRAGDFSPLDGLLVAIPARSLRGVWGLVTSPFLLKRLKATCELLHAEPQDQPIVLKELNETLQKAENLQQDEVIVSEEGKDFFSINNKVILNEEFELNLKPVDRVGGLKLEEGWRLMIVHDDIIREVVNSSMLRRARVVLKKETKTVEEGGLWEEEDVPPQTVFVTVFLYSDEETKETFEGKIFEEEEGYLVLGGHETVGRGIVKLRKV